ncbi:hypothetical protein [Caedibacter taeniospiralis]|uniref:hypothetical protein n=1 Tax=Caedibacter taeniospiralis TaxID=28907 RepID=UPI000C2700CF|nr:hypothetical protein [Caedibacter taeniospiralis]
MRLHIKLPTRLTTVTLHDMLYQLLSLKITGKPDSKNQVMNWLSQRLSDRLGKLPKRRSMNTGLSQYAVEEILEEIVQPEILKEYDNVNC